MLLTRYTQQVNLVAKFKSMTTVKSGVATYLGRDSITGFRNVKSILGDERQVQYISNSVPQQTFRGVNEKSSLNIGFIDQKPA